MKRLALLAPIAFALASCSNDAPQQNNATVAAPKEIDTTNYNPSCETPRGRASIQATPNSGVTFEYAGTTVRVYRNVRRWEHTPALDRAEELVEADRALERASYVHQLDYVFGRYREACPNADQAALRQLRQRIDAASGAAAPAARPR